MVESLLLPNISTWHSIVDGDSIGSELSLDDELGIVVVRTPSLRRSKATMNALRGDMGLHRFNRARNPLHRLNMMVMFYITMIIYEKLCRL